MHPDTGCLVARTCYCLLSRVQRGSGGSPLSLLDVNDESTMGTFEMDVDI